MRGLSNTVGLQVYATGSASNVPNVRATPNGTIRWAAKYGEVVGTWLAKEGAWHKIVDTRLNTSYIHDSCSVVGTNPVAKPPASSVSEEQRIVNETASLDEDSINTINYCSAMLDGLRRKGANISATHTRDLNILLEDICKRQAAIEASAQKGGWGKVTGRISSGWTSIKNFFGFRGLYGMGFVITTTTLVIIGITVLVGGASTLAVLKPFNTQARACNQALKRLEKQFEQMGFSETEIQAIVSAVTPELSKVYNKGLKKGKSGFNIKSVIIWTTVGIGALFVLPKLFNFIANTKDSYKRLKD